MKDHLIKFSLAIMAAIILVIVFWYAYKGLPLDIFERVSASADLVLNETNVSYNLLFWVGAIFLSLEGVEMLISGSK